MSTRSFTIHPTLGFRSLERRVGIKRVTVKLGSKSLKVRTRKGERTAVVDLRGRSAGTVRVRITVTLSNGRVERRVRSYHPCVDAAPTAAGTTAS